MLAMDRIFTERGSYITYREEAQKGQQNYTEDAQIKVFLEMIRQSQSHTNFISQREAHVGRTGESLLSSQKEMNLMKP